MSEATSAEKMAPLTAAPKECLLELKMAGLRVAQSVLMTANYLAEQTGQKTVDQWEHEWVVMKEYLWAAWLALQTVSPLADQKDLNWALQLVDNLDIRMAASLAHQRAPMLVDSTAVTRVQHWVEMLVRQTVACSEMNLADRLAGHLAAQ